MNLSRDSRGQRFLPVRDNPRWKGGKTITAKGYVRLTSGKYRNYYEHIAVTLDNINSATCLPPGFTKGDKLPAGMEVHHFDRNRQHNCTCNLMILQDVIHHHIEIQRRPKLSWYEKHRKVQGLLPLKHQHGALDDTTSAPF